MGIEVLVELSNSRRRNEQIDIVQKEPTYPAVDELYPFMRRI